MKIWVIFTNKTDISWLKILKPGFRHCYALLDDGTQWITYDPLSSFTDITKHPKGTTIRNLPLWFKSQGEEIIAVNILGSKDKVAPISFYNCVEAIKRLIGLHSIFIITPYQLYTHLKKNNKKETQNG